MQDHKESIIESLPYLRRYARALTNNSDLADHLVHECIGYAAGLTQFIHEGSSVKEWLFGVFHNLHSDTLKRNRGQRVFRVSQSSAKPTESVDLHSLAPLQKQVFLLVALEGFGYKEVAGMLDITLGELLSHIHGARKILRAHLKKQMLSMQKPEAVQ